MKRRPTFEGSLLLSLALLSQGPATIAEEPQKVTVSGWTRVIDPDDDCGIRTDDGKMTITVPPTNHNLNPNRGMNAPRVLQKVSGDFVVQVKVTGDFRPGTKSTKPKGDGRPFNGAGLLLWESEENFLRFERNAYWVEQRPYCYSPLIEYWHNGKDAGMSPIAEAGYFKGRSTWLKINRQGKDVTASVSHDGKEWTDARKFKAEFPEVVYVGVAAGNSSDAPFVVEFEGLEITSLPATAKSP